MKQPNIHQRPAKTLPIVISRNNRAIYLGDAEFLTDGSFVFKSSSHRSKNANEIVQFGVSTKMDSGFINYPADTSHLIGNGFHVSLHPPTKTQLGVMHFRENTPGQILFRRQINWFPVTSSFNLLHFFTLPLDTYPSTNKQVTVINDIDPSYHDSLEIIIDVFPRDTTMAHPFKGSFEVWGGCPHYLVRVSIIQAKARTAEFIYWPMDDILEL